MKTNIFARQMTWLARVTLQPSELTPENFIATTIGAFLNPHYQQQFEPQIQRIRALCPDLATKTANERKVKALKIKLPAGIISGVAQGGIGQDNIVLRNAVLSIDIDAKDNPAITDWQAVKRHLASLPYVAYAGLSSTALGVYALIPILDPARHKEHFAAIQRDFSAMGYVLDPVPANIASKRFLSLDTSPIWRNEAEVYEDQVSTEDCLLHKEGSMMGTEGCLLHKEGSMMGKEGGMMSKEGGMMSKGGSMMSKEGGMMSKEGGMMSKEGGMMSKEGCMMSKEGGMMSKEGSMMSKQGSMMGQEGGTRESVCAAVCPRGGASAPSSAPSLATSPSTLTTAPASTTSLEPRPGLLRLTLTQLMQGIPSIRRARQQDLAQSTELQPFDLEAFLQEHHIAYTARQRQGGTQYVVTCPWQHLHSSHSFADAAIFRYPDGRIGFKCLHAHCAQRTWQDFREFYEPEAYAWKL